MVRVIGNAGKRCSVPGCENSATAPEKVFAIYPFKRKRAKAWSADVSHSVFYVCEEHFDMSEDMFVSPPSKMPKLEASPSVMDAAITLCLLREAVPLPQPEPQPSSSKQDKGIQCKPLKAHTATQCNMDEETEEKD